MVRFLAVSLSICAKLSIAGRDSEGSQAHPVILPLRWLNGEIFGEQLLSPLLGRGGSLTRLML